ncbi:MAG: SGNH-hydro domain-containing protein [Burkholderia sp.]|jgi:hypothetical protein
MKSFRLCAAAALFLAAFSQASFAYTAPAYTEPLAESPRTMLIVGNSYSYFNCGVQGVLRGLMKSAGMKPLPKTRLLTISSGKLSYHDMAQYLSPHEGDPYAKTENGKLVAPMFAAVILQGNSQAITGGEKAFAIFRKYAVAHARTVREAGSVPMIVMTWPREGREGDIDRIADATIRVANEAKAEVIPVALAWTKVLKEYPEIRLYMPDHSHPSMAGTYLYASVLYSVLFRRSPEGLGYAGECEKPLKPEAAAALQKAAWETVSAFYGLK